MFKRMAFGLSLILLGLSVTVRAAENRLVFFTFQWTAQAHVGLSEVTLTYHITRVIFRPIMYT